MVVLITITHHSYRWKDNIETKNLATPSFVESKTVNVSGWRPLTGTWEGRKLVQRGGKVENIVTTKEISRLDPNPRTDVVWPTEGFQQFCFIFVAAFQFLHFYDFHFPLKQNCAFSNLCSPHGAETLHCYSGTGTVFGNFYPINLKNDKIIYNDMQLKWAVQLICLLP